MQKQPEGITILKSNESLPLTCSRKGTCCFGKKVLLNPWELATISHAKGLSVNEFSKQHCEAGGTKLLFDSQLTFKGYHACSQYIENFGCSVHAGRPLACRLYPIGRRIQNDRAEYFYEGDIFPCMHDCVEVTELPYLNIETYLSGQQTEKFEKVQDLYLELLQGIADIGMTLVLESGLTHTDIESVVEQWIGMCEMDTNKLASHIGADWLKTLMQPEISYSDRPEFYFQEHAAFIQQKIQDKYSKSASIENTVSTSKVCFGLALILAFSLGINSSELGQHWVSIIKSNLPSSN